MEPGKASLFAFAAVRPAFSNAGVVAERPGGNAGRLGAPDGVGTRPEVDPLLFRPSVNKPAEGLVKLPSAAAVEDSPIIFVNAGGALGKG